MVVLLNKSKGGQSMKIAFLGDSITEGCFELFDNPASGIKVIKDVEASYPSLVIGRLKKLFPEIQIEMINAGIGGETSGDGLLRVETDVIKKDTDIAVVCFGLNDIGKIKIEDYKENLNQIFKKLRSHKIETVFMTPNMINTYIHHLTLDILTDTAKNCAEYQNGGKMDLFMETARVAAQANDVEICDAYFQWKKLQHYGVNTTELLCNYINHPIRPMHRLFAELLEPFLIAKIKKNTRKS